MATNYNTFTHGIRIDEETSYGAGAVESDAISLGQVTNFTTTATDGTLRLLGIGEGRNETNYVYGPVDITGTIEWNVLADNAQTAGGSCSFMKFAIGKGAGSGSTASPFELSEFAQIDYTSMFSFAIYSQNEGGATDDVDLYSGCIGNSITWSFAVDDIFKASMDFTAKAVTSNTSITTPYVPNTALPFTFQQGVFKWGATPTTVVGVQSGTITLNNSPQIYRNLGSRFIVTPVLGRLTYDFTIVVKMTDSIATTLRDDLYGQANSFIAGTLDSIRAADKEIELTFAEGAASLDKTLTLALDQCAITSMSKPIPAGEGLVECTFTGIAKEGKPDSTINVPIRYHAIT